MHAQGERGKRLASPVGFRYSFSVRVTVIVPVRDGTVTPSCIAFVQTSKYPQEMVEILIVAGDSPSAQRNLAAENAAGEILYFIDDDSMLDARAIQRLVEAFADYPEIAGVGGPSIGVSSGSLFQKCAAMAMGSLFGFGPARHRHYPTGCPRIGGENELILSNLAIRKTVWQRYGGFDTRLYPNEENEWIRRLENSGQRFLYHPGVIVSRPTRETLSQLAAQVFRYGKSRAKHMRIAASALNVLLLLPALLVGYVLSAVPGAVLLLQLDENVLSIGAKLLLVIFLALPIAFYVSLCVGASLYAGLSVRKKKFRTFFWHLAIFPTLHFGYGAGWIRGCFGPIQKIQASEIHLHARRCC